VLIEHYAGEFPLWLAPVQVAVLPVSQNFIDFARTVSDEIKNSEIRVEVDERNEKLGYKIRDWEIKKVPYMLVIGEKEKESGNVRSCGLDNLTQHFGFANAARHRAAGDALVTADLLVRLLRLAREEGAHTLQDLAAIVLRRTGSARKKRSAMPTEPRADSAPELAG
jgi:histidyl-tRNA synthetase